jgi:hypothetical protein
MLFVFIQLAFARKQTQQCLTKLSDKRVTNFQAYTNTLIQTLPWWNTHITYIFFFNSHNWKLVCQSLLTRCPLREHKMGGLVGIVTPNLLPLTSTHHPSHVLTHTMPFSRSLLLQCKDVARLHVPRSAELVYELRVKFVLNLWMTGQKVETPCQHWNPNTEKLKP